MLKFLGYAVLVVAVLIALGYGVLVWLSWTTDH